MYLSRKNVNCLKGIAIIMMVIHHVLTFPDWWPDGFIYSQNLLRFAELFCSPLKLCVSIFAFITGYFYFSKDNKNYAYSFNKIIKFLIKYLVIYAFLLLLAYINNHNLPITLKDILLGLIGFDYKINCFNWYVYFYIITMLLLPILDKFMKRSNSFAILFGVILPVVFGRILTLFLREDGLLIDAVRNVIYFLPIVSFGYLFAKNKLFSIFDEILSEITNNKLIKAIVLFITLFISFFGRYCCENISFASYTFMGNDLSIKINLDVIYAPLFIYSIVNIFNYFKVDFKILQNIGVHSTSIWFIHCLFYNASSTTYNTFAYSLNNPLIALLIVFVSSYLLAIVFDWLIDRIFKIIGI